MLNSTDHDLLFLPFLPEKSSKIGTFFKQINFEIKKDILAPFKTSLFTVQPKANSLIDKHQVREIWIVSKATGLLNYENKIYQIKENDVVYFKPFSTHEVTNNGKNDLIILSIWW